MNNDIKRYIKNGFIHKDWYDCEARKLHDLLPEFKGLPIIRAFAVTSMTTSIEANVHLAIKALLQIKNNEEIRGFLPNQITYLNLIKEGKDVPGRKIMSFIKALEGDPSSVVVDIWMCRAFGTIRGRNLPSGRAYFLAPTKKEYDLIESLVIKLAKKYKVEPRQMQSIIWAGIKTEQSVFSKNTTWSDILIKKKGFFNFTQTT